MAKSGAPLPDPPPTVALPPFAPLLYPSLLLSSFLGEEGRTPPQSCGSARPWPPCSQGTSSSPRRAPTSRHTPGATQRGRVSSRPRQPPQRQGGGSCSDLRSRAKRASSSSAATPASLSCPPGGQFTGGRGGHRPSATAGSPMEGRVFNRFRRCSGLLPRWSDPG